MSRLEAYNFEGTEDFVFENSIIKGVQAQSPITHDNYGELILERMRADPSFVGQIDGLTGREETFAEMTEKSVKCAMWLKKLNVRPGDVIGICTHNQPDMYVPCFASLYVGAICNAWWDVGLTKEVARHFINLTRPKVLFVNEASASVALEVTEEIRAEIKIVVFGKVPGIQSLVDILATQDRKIVPEFRCTKLESPDNPAVIMYTSGSTGLPKGVVHSHKSLYHNIDHSTELIETEDTVTSLLFSPLAWLSGICLMLRGIVVPDRRVIYPEFTEETTLQLIEKFKVNFFLAGTSIILRLQKSPSIPNYDLSSLKFILVGGAAFSEDWKNAVAKSFPQADVQQCYGTTEMGAMAVRETDNTKPGSCGRLTKNFMLKVIDPDNGQILGPNKIGEGCFKYPFMMKCYYRNPEATNEAIDSEGWLHTGDLLRYDEEGYVFFVDRMKELIKYRGNHVSPGMIERTIMLHPGVVEAAVVAIPHEIDEEHPIAFVAKTPKADITAAEIEKLVADTLPDYMKLRGGVKFLDELPHTPSGKIARSELKKLAKRYVR